MGKIKELKITFVAGAVRPDLDAETVSETTDPLSCVSGTSLEGVHGSLFTFGVGIISLLVGDSLFRLIDCEVFAICL